MKKVYAKPEILFESFASSTNIAGDCEVKTNSPGGGKCGFEIKDEFVTKTLFTTEMVGVCNITETTGPYNGLCYHTPSEGFNLFNS